MRNNSHDEYTQIIIYERDLYFEVAAFQLIFDGQHDSQFDFKLINMIFWKHTISILQNILICI